MAVQHTFIYIYESAPIRNLTLFSIVAVNNQQLAEIMPFVGKHIFVSGETLSTSADTIGAYLIHLG